MCPCLSGPILNSGIPKEIVRFPYDIRDPEESIPRDRNGFRSKARTAKEAPVD
jgi:hypothetical protein